MRATGIVRRIDDLGRVVVPKEIRRILRIREGDPMEIFTDREGQVILKKYSPIGELEASAKEYADALSQVINHGVIISDTDIIVATSRGVKKEMIGKSISRQMEHAIHEREKIMAVKGDKKYIKIADSGLDEYNTQIIWPILSEGDVIGAIAFIGKDAETRMGETEQALAQCAASYLAQ
ncbi:MAG: stage V sporulation T C-terminal domain-containing protein [Lachnospiraceae bacterium]